jgi:hypothetical protein
MTLNNWNLINKLIYNLQKKKHQVSSVDELLEIQVIWKTQF